jgi:hypothetical protein
MPKLKYFGSHISDNIIKTDEGYIVCKNVPICRTGWQTYLGKELGEETQEEHSIGDSDKVKVYRSSEEVFSPDTISSFEAKPVTDSHPSNNRFVDSSNYQELLRGHVQNVHKGGELEDGEEVMLADMLVQDKGLVQDVLDNVKREVSCGYDYRLRLRSDGNFEQYNIQGNHVAIVPKGRAGDKVRIHDAAPASTELKESPVEKPTGMSWRNFWTSLGMRLHAADAKPEDMAEALDELRKEETPMSEKSKDSLSADDALRAKDAEIEELKGKLKEKESTDKKVKDAEPVKHADDCKCADCMGDKAKDKKGKDKRGKDAKAKDKSKLIDGLKKMLDEYLDEESEEPEHADDSDEDEPKGEDSDEDEEEEPKPKGEDAKLEPIPDLPKSERPKNPIPGADAAVQQARAVLEITRPIVAKSGDQKAIDRWNRAADALAPVRRATTRGGYDELANRDGIARQAVDAAASDAEPPMTAEQRAAEYQKHLDAKHARAPKGGN